MLKKILLVVVLGAASFTSGRTVASSGQAATPGASVRNSSSASGMGGYGGGTMCMPWDPNC
jgi:hypothetical protein